MSDQAEAPVSIPIRTANFAAAVRWAAVGAFGFLALFYRYRASSVCWAARSVFWPSIRRFRSCWGFASTATRSRCRGRCSSRSRCWFSDGSGSFFRCSPTSPRRVSFWGSKSSCCGPWTANFRCCSPRARSGSRSSTRSPAASRTSRSTGSYERRSQRGLRAASSRSARRRSTTRARLPRPTARTGARESGFRASRGRSPPSSPSQLPTPLPRAAISESMARWTVVICST